MSHLTRLKRRHKALATSKKGNGAGTVKKASAPPAKKAVEAPKAKAPTAKARVPAAKE